ncbi:hypothetical protein ACIRS1_05295 [Kitasatospora sp. NPDC101176]|uniref:hypothetical protein n=1 Tax=Kitasatospora sp. NPDC101176 TaxID=3364099 RepID=UPI00382234AF
MTENLFCPPVGSTTHWTTAEGTAAQLATEDGHLVRVYRDRAGLRRIVVLDTCDNAAWPDTVVLDPGEARALADLLVRPWPGDRTAGSPERTGPPPGGPIGGPGRTAAVSTMDNVVSQRSRRM